MNPRVHAVILGSLLLVGAAAGVYAGHNRSGVAAPVDASRLAGRTLVSMNGNRLCCDAGSLLAADPAYRGALVWILSGIDCTRCAAQQLGYWRRVAEQCGRNGGLGLALIGVGRDTAIVTAFAQQYRFPGRVQAVGSLEDIGLSGSVTPVSVLVDSASQIILASGDAASANPHPLHLLALSRVLSSCASDQDHKASSAAARATQ